MNNRDILKALIERAEYLLNNRGEYFTEGSKLAILDKVKDAKLALEGKYKVPFVRNREFLKAREEEEILFTTKRYTMAPTYNLDKMVYNYYGLEPALEWFEKQDVLYYGKEKLLEKAYFVIEKAEELLRSAKIGSDIGEYDGVFAEKLIISIDKVKKAKVSLNNDIEVEELAHAVVEVFNKIRDFQYSRVLRSEVDLSATLFLTKEGIEKVKENVNKDPLLKKQYKKIKEIADSFSAEYIKKSALVMSDDYEEINKNFYVWSSTDKIANFKAPINAVKANISFILPCEENEQEGLGHVWIDNLEVLSANGNSLDIKNGGFDEGEDNPIYWKGEALKGTPIMKWEDRYPYCGGGDKLKKNSPNPSSQTSFNYDEGTTRHSVYICNPSKEDEGAWTYQENIAVEGGLGYTLTFNAKLDGKFKKGLKTLITYKDEKDNIIETYEYYFNRKSSLPNSCFLLSMQCDAIEYMFTGNLSYAVKANQEILFTLNDFCQGAEHWLVTNLRPQGSDAYGAVQGGRVLSSIASTYSLIKEAGVFSKEEKEKFYALIEYMLSYMLDLRDRTELSLDEAQEGCSNWQTDMCAGTGLMMMVLEDFPNRKTWLYNANMVLKAQLELNLKPDSSWPESIRYHHAALERFIIYAKALEKMVGEDWFQTTGLAKMFKFSLSTQTPAYKFFNGNIGTPPFGDHALGGGSEFGSYATYITDVERVDKALADEMYHTWCKAGKPFKRFWGESIALENILGKGDTYRPSSDLKLASTKEFANSGIYIFRKGFGEEKESYFAIMSSPEHIGHGHLDQGSFVIYKNSIPIVMDSGIEGYFDSSTSWHISSYSHACMLFSTKDKNIETARQGMVNLTAGNYTKERGWVDVPKTSKVLECNIGGDIESIAIEIMNPEGEGKHIRKVIYVKKYDIYIIKDTVEDFEGEVLFSVPVASQKSLIEGNRVYSEGVYDIDLETVFLSKVKNIKIEKGRSTKFFNSDKNFCMLDYIRATADAEEGFLTVLYPKERGTGNIEIIRKDMELKISLGNEQLEVLI
jgi:hypothetical protein